MTRVIGVDRHTGSAFNALAHRTEARREYECATCGGRIRRADRYWHVLAFSSHRVCLNCEEAKVAA